MKLVKEACRAANAAEFIEELDEVRHLIIWLPSTHKLTINRDIIHMLANEQACYQVAKSKELR